MLHFILYGTTGAQEIERITGEIAQQQGFRHIGSHETQLPWERFTQYRKIPLIGSSTVPDTNKNVRVFLYTRQEVGPLDVNFNGYSAGDANYKITIASPANLNSKEHTRPISFSLVNKLKENGAQGYHLFENTTRDDWRKVRLPHQ